MNFTYDNTSNIVRLLYFVTSKQILRICFSDLLCPIVDSLLQDYMYILKHDDMLTIALSSSYRRHFFRLEFSILSVSHHPYFLFTQTVQVRWLFSLSWFFQVLVILLWFFLITQTQRFWWFFLKNNKSVLLGYRRDLGNISYRYQYLKISISY